MIPESYIAVSLTAGIGLLAWLLLNINKLLIRQAVNVRAVAMDEETAKLLAIKVEELAKSSVAQAEATAELARALVDFHVVLAKLVRDADRDLAGRNN